MALTGTPPGASELPSPNYFLPHLLSIGLVKEQGWLWMIVLVELRIFVLQYLIDRQGPLIWFLSARVREGHRVHLTCRFRRRRGASHAI